MAGEVSIQKIKELAKAEDFDRAVEIADDLRALNCAVYFTDNASAYVAFEDNKDVRVFVVDFESKSYREIENNEEKLEILEEFEGISEEKAKELAKKVKELID